MVVMHLFLDNIYSFSNFDIDFSYPKKIVNSLIENEHLEGYPNFRYKKINIIMGANATGKTTLGLTITAIVSYIISNNIACIENIIGDKQKNASIVMDLVDDGKTLRRISIFISSNRNNIPFKDRTELKYGCEMIRTRDSYQSCLARLEKNGLQEYSSDKISTLLYSVEWAMICANQNCNVLEGIDRKVLLKVFNSVMRTLDPSITEVIELPPAKNTYSIKKNGQDFVFQDDNLTNPQIFSSGTKEGIGLSYLIAGIICHTYRTYYCDEKFSYVHSAIEKRLLGLMMSYLGPNEQLFFTTHNEEMLDLNLPKHTYTFLVREKEGDKVISRAIYGNDYVKKYSDSLKTAIYNDVIHVLPDDCFLDELEEY